MDSPNDPLAAPDETPDKKTPRPAKAKVRAALPPEVKELPFDRFTIEVMPRKALTENPFNPRIMTDDQKRRLRAGLKKHGMLEPPVWNKQTGRLVGGHQRLAQLDGLQGDDAYTLQVAVVDLDEAAEKEAMILLNNTAAMGDWDLLKLDLVLKDTKVQLVGTGFDMADIYRLLGDAPGRSTAELTDLADKLSSFQSAYKKISGTHMTRDDYYLVVVCRDTEHRTEFLAGLGMEDNRYQDGQHLQKLLSGLEQPDLAPDPAWYRDADGVMQRYLEPEEEAVGTSSD
jgi:hypothetical protein